MKRFEYKTSLTELSLSGTQLSGLGLKGWDLVSVNQTMKGFLYTLKRELHEDDVVVNKP